MKSAVIAALLLLPTSSPAQRRPLRPAGGELPTTGVRLHAPAVVGKNDASYLEVNPGAGGFLRSWNVMLHHSELRGDGRVQGTGTAAFAASPLPFYTPLVLGAGFQWLRPADTVGYADTVKLTLGAAWRPRSWLSFGLGFHTFIADRDDGIDALTSLDAGVVARPLPWVAAGFAVRNLTTPKLYGLPVQRVYDFEVAGRPLGNQRLLIAAGFAIGERRANLDPHFRVMGELLWGLRVFSHLQLLRRDFYRDDNPLTDVRVTAGVAVNLERIGLAVSSVFGRSLPARPGISAFSGSNARSAFQGINVSLRFRGDRQRPLFVPFHRIVRIELGGDFHQREMIGLIAALTTIERRNDIKAVFVEIDGLSIGWAQTQELRSWFERLRRAGKRVLVYLRAPSTKEYYLAAAADHLMLDPAGGLRLQGVASSALYFRGLFDKLGVTPQFVRIAEYKSAPEQWTRSGPTPPAQEMHRQLVGGIFSRVIADLSRDRKRPPAKIREIIDRGPYTPPLALKAGLVDEIVDPEQIVRRVQQLTRAQMVSTSVLSRASTRWPNAPAVAVVVIEGDIIRGKNRTIPLIGRRTTGDETIAQALAWARGSRRVKSVVLRINSPGGSAMASDRIWRALQRLRKVKPLVVSLADVAASGGYYVAAPGEKIFAQPSTITGSIGIFTGKFDISGLLTKLGITSHTIEHGKRATMDSLLRPYSKAELALIRSRLDYYYKTFLDVVGKGREMKMEQVDRIARGHVWTGRQARARKLVDSYGGLAEAVAEAKKLAGMDADDHADLLVLPRAPSSFLQRALELLAPLVDAGRSAARALPRAVREALETLPPVLWTARSNEPLARMPYDIRQ